MSDAKRFADIETLARLAARLAERDPDEHVTVRLGDAVAFNDVIWRYSDFLARATAAYRALEGALNLPS